MINRKDVDWDATRIIFVSSLFTDFQINATSQDLPIELFEVRRYSGDIIIATPIKKINSCLNNVKTLSTQNATFEELAKEVKVYTEDCHLQNVCSEIKNLYQEIRDTILGLDLQIQIEPKKFYIAFKKDLKNICDIEIQKKQLKIYINNKKGFIDDPKKLFRDVSQIGHLGNGDYQIIISNDDNLEYILSVIKQLL